MVSSLVQVSLAIKHPGKSSSAYSSICSVVLGSSPWLPPAWLLQYLVIFMFLEEPHHCLQNHSPLLIWECLLVLLAFGSVVLKIPYYWVRLDSPEIIVHSNLEWDSKNSKT